MPGDLWLALEGGGTRSQAALLEPGGRVLYVSEAAGVNTNFIALADAQQAVRAAVQGALEGAQIHAERVAHCVSALVGPRFGAELLGTLIPRAVYHYYGEGDVVFARAGLYCPHGVAVVAGTGATAWGVRADDGRRVICGGWGALLGDEGSAYALGLAGLRAAVRAFEGRAGQETRLFPAVCAHFGLAGATFREELVRLAYNKPLSRAEIAALAVVVTRLAGEGDALAGHLTAQVAADLAGLALHTVRRLFGPGERFDVVVAGGLTNAGDLVLAPLRRGLAEAFPRATFAVGTEAPAVALCRRALFDGRGIGAC